MQLLTLIRTTWRRWAVMSEVHRELSAYSERELADLGIRRSEIAGIAREAAARIQPKMMKADRKAGTFAKTAAAN
ncbi:uncharacterized protein DUF1127 [Dongia mobilis]|uniref:Uncharacterized protein DUF1127 n=1 Tax=Dongia mobilis TaxID=578943 RepID=A0A4R6WSL0_9PROT|nr:DUF1127 domain-containing protein [Dongia mobilis]TDQ85438.1 uncharacterized protein DUF1127 [Dongia mobilis]